MEGGGDGCRYISSRLMDLNNLFVKSSHEALSIKEINQFFNDTTKLKVGKAGCGADDRLRLLPRFPFYLPLKYIKR
jgi:hypothetical protein